MITIVLPTYNEAESVAKLLPELVTLGLPIIVVDDNSPDGTARLAQELGSPLIQVSVRLDERGLGSAIRHGAKLAQTPYVLVMDSDGQHSVEDLVKIRKLVDLETDVVIGSRLMDGGSVVGLPIWRKIASHILNWLGGLRAQTRATDYLTGFFCARRELVINTVEDGFKILYEILKRNRLTIKETPITLHEREFGQSKANWMEIKRYLKLVFS